MRRLRKFIIGPMIIERIRRSGDRKPNAIITRRIPGPYGSSLAKVLAALRGSNPSATLKPSSGAIGRRLNTARIRFQKTRDTKV